MNNYWTLNVIKLIEQITGKNFDDFHPLLKRLTYSPSTSGGAKGTFCPMLSILLFLFTGIIIAGINLAKKFIKRV